MQKIFSRNLGAGNPAKADSGNTCESGRLLREGFSAQSLGAGGLRSTGKAAWPPGQPDTHRRHCRETPLRCVRNHPRRRRLKKPGYVESYSQKLSKNTSTRCFSPCTQRVGSSEETGLAEHVLLLQIPPLTRERSAALCARPSTPRRQLTSRR